MNRFTKLFLTGLLSVSTLLAFEPTIDKVEVNDINIYLLPEDGEANEDGLIDQFWLSEALKSGNIPKGIHLVDVRKPSKFNAQHIKGAINVPFDKDEESIDISKLPTNGIVVFYCNTGLMSTDARSILDDDLAERVFIFDANICIHNVRS